MKIQELLKTTLAIAVILIASISANSTSSTSIDAYELSEELMVVSAPSAPANFRITGGSYNTRNFAWNAVPGATGYYFHVYVGTTLIAKFPLSGTSYNFGTASGTFTMYVTAYNGSGESVPSNSITTTLYYI